LYMRLAEHKNAIDKQRVASYIDEGKLSIRAAAKLIPQTETQQAAAAKRKATAASNKATKAAVQFEDLLRGLEPEEVYTALKSTHPSDYLLALANMILKGRDGLNIPPELDRRSSPSASTAPADRRM